ncbi:MAG: ABC transporter substrate-binding protein [Patescibacteria group bacterium]
MKHIFIGCVALALLVGFLALSGVWHKNAPIKIGYISPLSGDASTYGEPMRRAAALAVDEINAAGGISGRPLQILYEDSRCVGRDALSAVKKLASVDGVRIISGFTCAEDVLTSAAEIEKNKILALAPGASGPSVSGAGDYIFQINPSATIATQKLVEVMRDEHDRVAVVSENTGFATDVRDYFADHIFENGGSVVANETFQPETKDFRSLLLKIKNTQPTAIFVNPQTEIAGGLIMKQARELGIDATFFGLDTLSGPTAIETAGPAAEGLVLITVPDLDSENNLKAKQFLNVYGEEYGAPPFPLYLAAAYDSIYIIAQAVTAVGDDPTRIKEYLYHMPVFVGAVGTYHFDHNGDLVGLNFVVKLVSNGALVIVL